MQRENHISAAHFSRTLRDKQSYFGIYPVKSSYICLFIVILLVALCKWVLRMSPIFPIQKRSICFFHGPPPLIEEYLARSHPKTLRSLRYLDASKPLVSGEVGRCRHGQQVGPTWGTIFRLCALMISVSKLSIFTVILLNSRASQHLSFVQIIEEMHLMGDSPLHDSLTK